MDKYLSVSTINRYLKNKLDNDSNLHSIYLKGEISNLKYHGIGHIYFSLKDENSKINAIMFSTYASKLNFKLNDGMNVLVKGHISVYEATGNYQIYVEDMQQDGIGNLYIEFEKLKKKLDSEGLFDSKHKKIIPKFPQRIGVITANTGAAIKDIITTIKRRYPIGEIILFPSLVQGEYAKDDLVKKISQADNYNLDVLIVGRGGGSIEDLWPFNEEIVARSIFNCKTPIISAIGHEIDYTIADFVSDLRAPTPTAAAELAVPNLVEISKYLDQLKIRLNENILKKININRLYLDNIKNSYILKNPHLIFEAKKQKLDLLNEKINKEMKIKLDNNKIIIKNIIEKLNLLNPLNILKRGYTLTYHNDLIVNSIKNIKINDNLNIKLNDGVINAIVKEIKDEI